MVHFSKLSLFTFLHARHYSLLQSSSAVLSAVNRYNRQIGRSDDVKGRPIWIRVQ